MKQHNVAEEYLEKALMIQRRTELGEKNERTAQIYRYLATVHNSKEEVQKAKKFYEIAMDIAKETCGEKHPLVAEIHHDLERLYQRTGKKASER